MYRRPLLRLNECDVRCWPKADLRPAPIYVRFRGKNGHQNETASWLMTQSGHRGDCQFATFCSSAWGRHLDPLEQHELAPLFQIEL